MNILKHGNFPFFFLGIIYLAIHFFLPAVGDDVFSVNTEYTGPIFARVKELYYQWSSRPVISAFTIFFLRYKLLWIFVSPLFIAAGAYCISFLFANKDKVKFNWFICALFLIYPFMDMQTAGYVCTTTNYLWPAVFMLVAFIPVKKFFENKIISYWEYPLYAAALIIACNIEQGAGIIAGTYFLVILILLQRGSIKPFAFIQFALALAVIVFILSAPGNANRMSRELAVWFPDFFQIPFSDIANLAFSSATYHYLFKPNGLFLIFYVLVILVTWQKTGSLKRWSVVSVPAFTVIVFGYFCPYGRNAMTKYGINDPLMLFLLFAASLCIAYSVFSAFKDKEKGLLCLYVIFAGFCSRMVLMFSPTIWGSQTRTYTFMNFALIIASVMLFKELDESKFSKWKGFYVFAGITAAASVFILVIYIVKPDTGIVLIDKLKHLLDLIIARYDLIGWEMAVKTIAV